MNKASRKKREYTTQSGHIVKLTTNQKSYADIKLANPDLSLVQVAKQSYPNANDDTARQIVNVNEKNKDIAIYSEEQSNKAILTVVELMDSTKDDIRFKAATDILDRTHGKAVQRQITQNTNTNLNVEVSEELAQNFTEFLKQQTQQG